jgi:hypothetical protein
VDFDRLDLVPVWVLLRSSQVSVATSRKFSFFSSAFFSWLPFSKVFKCLFGKKNVCIRIWVVKMVGIIVGYYQCGGRHLLSVQSVSSRSSEHNSG